MLLRLPTPPGRVGLYTANAAAGLLNKLGPVARRAVSFPGTAPLAVAAADHFQLVGQAEPLVTQVGSPEVQRIIPESCQPPMNASCHPEVLEPNLFPCPNGSSAMPLKLILWRTSKSETACRRLGCQELIVELESTNNPLRSTREAQSIDFASV